MKEDQTASEEFNAAYPFLKEGRVMKLPEWGGFWFACTVDRNQPNQVFVLTKEGIILSTPDYSYAPRNDWECIHLISSESQELFIKANRKAIDEIMKKVKQYVPASREASLVFTSLQLSFMWLGKALGKIGATNPYPESFNPNSNVIEKHADKSEGDVPFLIVALGGLDEIGIIKALRLEIMHRVAFVRWAARHSLNAMVSLSLSLQYLEEASMWLGQCLNNIREQQESK